MIPGTKTTSRDPNKFALWFVGGPADKRYVFADALTPMIRVMLHNGATVTYRMTNQCIAGAVVYVCTP